MSVIDPKQVLCVVAVVFCMEISVLRDHFVVNVVVFLLHENVIYPREPLKSWDDIVSPVSSRPWSFTEWAAFETDI